MERRQFIMNTFSQMGIRVHALLSVYSPEDPLGNEMGEVTLVIRRRIDRTLNADVADTYRMHMDAARPHGAPNTPTPGQSSPVSYLRSVRA